MRLNSLAGTGADFDDLVRRFVGSEQNWPSGGYRVPTDVFHIEGALVVRMDLPEVKPDEIEVTFQDNVLIVNGTRHFPFDADKVRFMRRGTFYGDFTQRIALGKGLDVEKIQARYESGVLELMIPYAEEIKPRKIEISPSDTQAIEG